MVLNFVLFSIDIVASIRQERASQFPRSKPKPAGNSNSTAAIIRNIHHSIMQRPHKLSLILESLFVRA